MVNFFKVFDICCIEVVTDLAVKVAGHIGFDGQMRNQIQGWFPWFDRFWINLLYFHRYKGIREFFIATPNSNLLVIGIFRRLPVKFLLFLAKPARQGTV
jgi:hypothetical protein